eukprot:152421-Pyramimonas_sp.AAC.1
MQVFRMIDRCIRWAAGQQIADQAMHAILEAYHQCWMQRGPATSMYFDGEGRLISDAATAILKAAGAELRVHASVQRAAAIEARDGVLRRALHVVDEEFQLSPRLGSTN